MALIEKQNEKTKCRPSLSIPQISYLLRLVRADYNKLGTDEAAKLIKVLAPILAKAELLPTQGSNNTSTNPVNIPTPHANNLTTNSTSYASKEEYWEACFNLVTQHPTTYLNLLSAEELNAAYEHMYLNNYFTPREVRLFEAGEDMSRVKLSYVAELIQQAEQAEQAEQSNNPKHNGTVDNYDNYDNYDGDDSFMRDLI